MAIAIPDEQVARSALQDAVARTRAALARCPYVEEIDNVDAKEIQAIETWIAAANDAVDDALRYTDAIAEMGSASRDAIALTATSRVSLDLVREVLATLTAAIDARDLAK